jgi:hypothetical protein
MIDSEGGDPESVPAPAHWASEKFSFKSALNLQLKPARKPKKDVPVELPGRTPKRDRTRALRGLALTRTVTQSQAPQVQAQGSGYRIRVEVARVSCLLLQTSRLITPIPIR